MLKEFKEFVMRGNVVDLAVAVIIGASFGAIITSLVNDIIMPPIGLLVGKVDFASLFINLSGKPYATIAEAKAAGAPTINYGIFLNAVINFVIVAFAVFLVIKQINRFKRKPEEKPVDTKSCTYCFSAISLKATRCPNCTSQLT